MEYLIYHLVFDVLDLHRTGYRIHVKTKQVFPATATRLFTTQ